MGVVMKKLIAFLLFAVVAMAMAGCGARIYTNIPLRGTTITIFNETGYRLRVVNDGRLLATIGTSATDNYYPVVKKNYHQSSAQSSITVTAIGENNQPIGSASMSISVNGRRRIAKDWVITKKILHR
jgi:hypothetical protein